MTTQSFPHWPYSFQSFLTLCLITVVACAAGLAAYAFTIGIAAPLPRAPFKDPPPGRQNIVAPQHASSSSRSRSILRLSQTAQSPSVSVRRTRLRSSSSASLIRRPQTPPPAEAFVPSPDSTTCVITDLTVTTRVREAGDELNGSIIFTNEDEQTCTLAGFPSVRIRDEEGNAMTVDARQAFQRVNTLTLASKEKAMSTFSWMNWCGEDPDGSLIFVITLPGQSGYLSVPLITPLGRSVDDGPNCVSSNRGSTFTVSAFSA